MRISTALLLIVSLATTTSAYSQGPLPDLAGRIAAGWERIREAERQPGAYRVTYQLKVRSKQEVTKNIVYTYKTSGSMRKVESDGQVICMNDQYTFALARNPDSEGWRLEKLFITGAGPAPPDMVQLLVMNQFELITRPTTTVSPDLSYYDHMEDGRLKVTDIKPTEGGLSTALFTLEFRHPAAEAIETDEFKSTLEKLPPAAREKVMSNLKRKRTTGGTMTLDPRNSWRPVKILAKKETPSPLEETITLSYATTAGDDKGGIRCQRLAFASSSPDSKMDLSLDYEPSGERVRDDEFYLTHYDLPEPVGVTRGKPTPVYVWILIAAGGVGALAVLFRWLARRRQPAPATM